MKKLLFLFCLYGASVSLFGATYDLNTRVIQNDNVVGGNFVVEVQVRSTAGTMRLGGVLELDNQAGGFIAHLQMNSSTLAFSSGTLNPIFNPFQLKTTNYGALNGVRMMARTRNDAVFVDIPTTWTTLATITYTIVSLSPAIDFEFKPNAINLNDFTGANTVQHGQNDIANSILNDNGVWTGGNGPGGSLAADGSDLGKPLTIRNSASPVVLAGPGNYRVDDFVIEATGKLEIDPNASFEPWSRVAYNFINGFGTVKVDADATGYGQYKGPAIPITYSQYYGTHNGWRNVAFPVSGASNFNFGMAMQMNGGTSARCIPTTCGEWGDTRGETANIYGFTSGLASATNLSPVAGSCVLGAPTPACGFQVQHEYAGLSGTPTGGAQGYVMWAGVHPQSGVSTSSNRYLNYPITTGIISVDGTSIVNTTYNYTSTAPHAGGTGSMALRPAGVQASWDGWRIIANPFTCNWDIQTWAVANGISGNGIVLVSASAMQPNSMPSAGALPTYIAPGQSIYIKMPADALVTFDLYRDGIIASGSPVLKTNESLVNLNLTGEDGFTSNAQIAFDESATDGYDVKYDGYYKAANIFDEDAVTLALDNEMEIDGLKVNSLLHRNTTNNAYSQKTFELYVDNLEPQKLTFSVDKSTLPQGVSVAIEDKEFAPGKLYDVVGDSYTFTSIPGTSNNRFVVHLNAFGAGASQLGEEGISAWFNGDLLNLNSDITLDGASVQIMNTAGQLVATGIVGNPIIVAQNGVYIVNVTTKTGTNKTVKVVKF